MQKSKLGMPVSRTECEVFQISLNWAPENLLYEFVGTLLYDRPEGDPRKTWSTLLWPVS